MSYQSVQIYYIYICFHALALRHTVSSIYINFILERMEAGERFKAPMRFISHTAGALTPLTFYSILNEGEIQSIQCHSSHAD